MIDNPDQESNKRDNERAQNGKSGPREVCEENKNDLQNSEDKSTGSSESDLSLEIPRSQSVPNMTWIEGDSEKVTKNSNEDSLLDDEQT